MARLYKRFGFPEPPPRIKNVSVRLTDEEYQVLRRYKFERNFDSFSEAIGALIRELGAKKQEEPS
jgi:predicted CopG family antitoxin